MGGTSRYQKRLHITGKLDQLGAYSFTGNLRQRLQGRLVQPLTHLLHVLAMNKRHLTWRSRGYKTTASQKKEL